MEQHYAHLACLLSMERKQKHDGTKEVREQPVENSVYERATPMWTKYYRKVRSRIRFPRYYKKALNW